MAGLAEVLRLRSDRIHTTPALRASMLRCHHRRMADASKSDLARILDDDPVANEEADLFNRGPFADRVVQVLSNVAAQTPSAVFGLLGPWGSGKTSALEMVRRRLENTGQWSVVQLNPWMVADLPSLIDEFFRTLITAVPKAAGAGGLREKLARYAGTVASASSPLRLLGIDAPGAVSGLQALIEGDVSLESRRTDLEGALEDLECPIILILDDLDRLQPDELLLIFKLVRLLGRLPNTYYLLAFDERTAIDVLTQTGLANDDPARALAYLEKVVQIRLDLPPAHPMQVERLLDESLTAIIEHHEVEWSLDDQKRLGAAYTTHMKRYLREPRQVKRYCAQVEALYPLVRGEVNFADFAIVTFLRTFHPGLVPTLLLHRSELTRTAFDFGRKKTRDESAALWRQRVEEVVADPADVESVLGLLAGMFGVIGSVVDGIHMSGHSSSADRRSVETDEYFDRYFYLGVSDSDIADATVRSAIGELLAGAPGASWAAVVSIIHEHGPIALDKLRRFAPTDSSTARCIAPHVAQLGPVVPERGFLDRGQPLWRIWLAELIDAAEPDDPNAFARELVEKSSILAVARACHASTQRAQEESLDPSPTMVAVIAEIVRLIRESLEAQALLPVTETTDVYGLLSYWTIFEPGADVREWFSRAVEVGRWAFPDAFALFASVGTLSGAHGPVPALGDANTELLEAAVGLHEASSLLPDDFTIQSEPHWGTDVSFEARRLSVMNAVARWSKQIAAHDSTQIEDGVADS